MPGSPAIYIRLKIHLILQRRTLTEYAAALGTSANRIYSTLRVLEDRERMPEDPLSIKILETIAKDLDDPTILPVQPIDAE